MSYIFLDPFKHHLVHLKAPFRVPNLSWASQLEQRDDI